MIEMSDHRMPDDRPIIVEPIEGKTIKNSSGIDDPRLFKGGNRLRIVRDGATCLWSYKYDIGGVPPALKDLKFTNFAKAFEHAKTYYAKRNLNIRFEV